MSICSQTPDNQRLTGLCFSFCTFTHKQKSQLFVPLHTLTFFLSYSFCLFYFLPVTLFFAFFAAQNQVAPSLGTLGTASLAILYFFFALTSAVTPSILQLLTHSTHNSNSLHAERNALLLGSALYSPFLFACSLGPTLSARWMQLISSAVLGVGAGLLWVAQGSLLTASCNDSNRGRWSGIFWASFMSGNAAGNFATAYSLKQLTMSTVFVYLAGVSLASTVGIFFLVRPRSNKEGDEQVHLIAAAAEAAEAVEAVEAPPLHPQPHSQNGWAILVQKDFTLLARAAFQTPSISALLPLLLFIGCENCFWSGAFPDIISARHGKDAVAMVLGVLASSDIVSSLLSGVMLDCKLINARVLLMLGLFLFGGGAALVWMERRQDSSAGAGGGGKNMTEFVEVFSVSPSSSSSMWLVYSAAVCMGVGDGVANTVAITRLQVLAERYQLLSKRTAFQLFQCFNVAMTSATFGVLSTWSVVGKGEGNNVVWWLLGLLILMSMVCVFCSPGNTYEDGGSEDGD